ncbi:MAG: glycolate oxidase subunit GlcE [Betaproteobacteria bacterium]|nr:glycolate oxidase subunit GlcE [Betaproteobacteria bacterium]
MPGAIADFAERIRACAAAGGSLCLRGGGSKDFYGGAALGELLDTREHAGILAYEPSELVITARCGTPLEDIEAELDRNGQMLAFEPPHFGSDATIGGAVAAGLSGPRRASAGALRDFVLGVKLMDGRGEALTFGGQVMKNVAGYDVSRLVAGSLGTLGLILEVSLKTLPAPKAEVTLLLEMPEDKAIHTLNQWAGRPLPLSAVAWNDGDLGVRLSGAEAAVVVAAEKLGGTRVEPAQAGRFWRGIREHTDPYFNNDKPLWRVSVPSNAPPLGLPGEQLIEWNGALRWLATNAEARAIREAASTFGGHATLFRGGDKAVGVFHPLSAPLMAIHRRLKNVFDPGGVFNRGRMYGEF